MPSKKKDKAQVTAASTSTTRVRYSAFLFRSLIAYCLLWLHRGQSSLSRGVDTRELDCRTDDEAVDDEGVSIMFLSAKGTDTVESAGDRSSDISVVGDGSGGPIGRDTVGEAD